MPDRHLVDVHILVVDSAQRLLLSRRGGNDEFTGRWHLPAGKLDAGESLTTAAARETWEETGLRVDPATLRPIHMAHITAPGTEPRLGVFFHAEYWTGIAQNREPDKCQALDWFPLDALPADLIEYPALGIAAFRSGAGFTLSELGWPEPGDA